MSTATITRRTVRHLGKANSVQVQPTGWGGEDPDGKVHYFANGASLCAKWEASDIGPDDLIQCDPLALENCPECRTVLLLQRGLIVPVQP